MSNSNVLLIFLFLSWVENIKIERSQVNFLITKLLIVYVSEPQCVASANGSAEWVQKNFGGFSIFATVTDFYMLNPTFSGVS